MDNSKNKCHHFGVKRHWLCTCCTASHLVDLYQASLKENENKTETNFVSKDTLDNHCMVDMNHLDVSNFFEDEDENIGHLVNDENVY